MQKQIGKIVVSNDHNRFKLEFIFDEGIDPENLLAQLGYTKEVNYAKNLDVYFGSLWGQQDLPVTVYARETYYGLRSDIDNKTLLFWNTNGRIGYMNISIKTKLLDLLVNSENEDVEPLFDFVKADDRFKNTKRIFVYEEAQLTEVFNALLPAVTNWLSAKLIPNVSDV